ncbi:outer membrane porin, OprD family [Pseudomonas syringae]|nr:outer membrane porin, OprD family [Pseudomonas syringae]MBD8791383.1 outer membrane porin, OprD family [Pseudomonas syringae]MBD8801483.1 outer membrane porin, OprD family [Pseudomonas syringae]MBD8810240.1 outer membrane porin, OprD family [Pseudomonas syringae]
MLSSFIARSIGITSALGLGMGMAHADVWQDSHLKIDMKNLWLDRNFTESGAATSKVGNWSQGFDLQFTSGYTETPLAFGLDLDAQYAYVLDSEGNDGTLPYDRINGIPDDYSRAGATLKMKYSQTELKVGDMRPELPIAWHDPSRQLDTIYQGAVIESKEIPNLTLTGGRFWSAVTRESSDHEKFYKYGSTDNLDSKGLDFGGATYNLLPNLQASYFYGVMHDIYQQHYYGLMHQADLGNGYTLRTDVRWFDNNEDGQALNGEIDNRALSTGLALTKGGHRFSVAYQRMYGDSIFPTPNGYIPQFYLLNWANQPFMRPQERSVGLGYSYDFAGLGVPGLTFSTRYIKGKDIQRAGLSDGHENERDLALRYVVQNGPLKGLGVEWKNYLVQQNFGDDFQENRLYTTYTWKLW